MLDTQEVKLLFKKEHRDIDLMKALIGDPEKTIVPYWFGNVMVLINDGTSRQWPQRNAALRSYWRHIRLYGTKRPTGHLIHTGPLGAMRWLDSLFGTEWASSYEARHN